MLTSNRAFELMSLPFYDKCERSIELIQMFFDSAMKESNDGYWLAFSGGKDSVALKGLADSAGVKYRAVYNVTTIDPPELVRFIKSHHPDVEWNRPKVPFFIQLVNESAGPPTRHGRWCCRKYKEHGGNDHVKLLGIRASESGRRARIWDEVTPNNKSGKIMVMPMFYWSDSDVWRYIRENNIKYCKLYDEGFTRLGCIGCPMTNKRKILEDFDRWPRYGMLWKRAINKYYDKWVDVPMRDGRDRYLKRFKDGDELFQWWLDGVSPEDKLEMCNQIELFDDA